MDLVLDDYQALLVATFRQFFAERAAGPEQGGSPGESKLWRAFVDIGGPLVGSPDPQEATEGSLIDAVLVAMEAGREVTPLPVAEVLTARRLLARAGAPLRVPEPELLSIYVPSTHTLRWRADGRVTGSLGPTRGAADCRYLVTPVDGVVAVLDAALHDAAIHRQPSLGSMSLAVVELPAAAPVSTFEPDPGALMQARADLRVLHAAELVGAADRAIQRAVEYTKQRRQFDRVIAAFQAVQHRLVDCRTATDAAELLALRAASYQNSAPHNLYYSAVALLHAIDAAERAAVEGLQFHGGYGYTLELEAHRYVRFAKELGVLARDRELTRDALPERAFGLLEGVPWTSR